MNTPIVGTLVKTLSVGKVVKSLASFQIDALAVGTSIGNIHILNTTTYLSIRNITAHTDWVQCLKVLSDGTTIASGSYDKTIKTWNSINGQLLKTLLSHTNYVMTLEQLSDGSLASGSTDQTVKIWNVSSGALLKTIQMNGDVYQVILANSGSYLTIRLPIINNVVILQPQTSVEVRRISSSSNCMTLLVNDGNLAVGGNTNIAIWDVNSGTSLRVISAIHPVSCLQLLSDGTLSSGLSDGSIQIWNTTNGQMPVSFVAHASTVYTMTILSNGYLVSVSGNQIKVWK